MYNPFEKDIRDVYGPYVRTYKKSGPRRQVNIIFSDGTKTSMSYARWLMTQHLKRRLLPTEHVDHKDEDPLNDTLDNFQLLTKPENSRKSALGKPSPQKGITKGWTHGTLYAWQKRKCACDICYAAKRAWNDRRNEARRK